MSSQSKVGTINSYNESQAKHPQFIAFTKRYQTFNSWPNKYVLQSARNMSLAGFYYMGSADRTRCFYCGLTLRDWDEDDDPFASHRQWSPLCAYISTIAEQQLNSGIQNLHVNNTRSTSLPGYSTSRSTTYAPTCGVSSDSFTHSDSISVIPNESSNANIPTVAFSSQTGAVLGVATSIDGPEEGVGSDNTLLGAWSHPPHVQAVLEMGYSLEDIQQRIEARRRAGLGEFANASALMSAIEGWD